jgi:hypothetical protein
MNDLRNWALKKIDEANSLLAAILIVIFVLLIVFLILTGIIWITMWIWNAVMPVIFGLPEITFWQTVGLSWICDFFIKPTINTKNNKD